MWVHGRVDGHERGAVPVEAGVVGVARRLVDLRFAAQLGVDRVHRQAAALDAAVAAALAHRLVDDHPLAALRRPAPLAQPAKFVRAGLVVDQNCDAGHGGQHPFGFLEPVPAPHLGPPRRPAREPGPATVPAQVIGHDEDAGDPLGGQHRAGVRHVELPGRVLAAGHRHDAVVEQLEGHGDVGGDRCPHNEAAGVEERPVAHVLDVVRGVGEGGTADPLRALAAHLGVRDGAAVHPPYKRVAAHTGTDRRAGRLHRRAVVGTATAERGGPRCLHGHDRQRRPRHRGLGEGGDPATEPTGQQGPQPLRGQLPVRGDDRPVPFVPLADHPRAVGAVVEGVADEPLHERPLLLDD